MDITIDGLGNFLVTFNGVTFTCGNDADCPGEAICARNVDWSVIQPGMCVCSVDFTRTGATCSELTPHSLGMIGLWLIGLAVALIAFTLNAYDVFLLRQANIKFTWSAVQTSVRFLFVGAFAMVLGSLLLIGEMVAPQVLVTRADGQLKKGPSFFVFTNIVVALAMFFVQLGLFNVCLVWLEVTNVRTRVGEGNIQRTRTPALFLTMVYFVLIVIFIGLDRIIFLAYASLPMFVVMLAGYVIGYRRMALTAQKKRRPSNTVIRTSAADNPAFDQEVGVMGLLGLTELSKPKSTNRLLMDKRKENNVKKKLRNIANLTIALLFFGINTVVAVVVAAGLNGSEDSPLISVTGYLHRSAWVCFATCLLIISIYVHQQICVLVGKKSRFVSSQTSLSDRRSSRMSMALWKKKSAGTLVRNRDDDKRGMAEILNKENPELRLRFTEFVRSKYADEPLVFYDACTRYQETAQTSRKALKGKNILLQTLGQQIIDNFVREDSAKWVNISDEIRHDILATAERNEFDERTFDKAKAMAFELLKQNFYNQFVAMLEKEARTQDEKDHDEVVVNIKSVADMNL